MVRVNRTLAVIACVCWVLSTQGCISSSAPKKACLSIEAVETLNLYDGKPHSLTLYVYPLSSVEGFEQANADDLLSGTRPAGMLAPPIPITVEPSEFKRSFQDLFPRETHHIGVIADYYRAPGDAEGSRQQVLPARCGILKPTVRLGSTDLLLD